jgi:hypothetical protein
MLSYSVALAFLAGLASGSTLCVAGETEVVSLQPKKLYVFGNGYSFVELQGYTGSATSMRLENIPPAMQGTFWVDVAKPAEVFRISSEDRTLLKPKEGNARYSDLLKANVGARVTLTLNQGPSLNGTLLMALDEGRREILVQTDRGIVSVKEENIVQLEFPDLKELKPALDKKKEKTIRLDLKKEAPGCEIVTTALSHGMEWSASYKMDLSTPQEAVLAGKATIVNRMASLEKVQLELVSGTPDLDCAGKLSPLFKILDIVEEAEPMDNVDGASMHRTRFLAQRASSMASRDVAEEVEAQGLYFYPQGEFSCKKGDVVELPLFETKLAYEHVYTLNIPDNKGGDSSDEVWHCIRIKNTTDRALAPGSVEFMSNGRITGQGSLQFTGKNAQATIRQNKASEILTRRMETIVKGTLQRKSKLTANEDNRITVEGTLIIRNGGKEKVTMEVSKNLLGLPICASNGGELQSSPLWNTWSKNPKGLIKWIIQIEPDTEQQLTYSYEYVE